jgi:hypothetical protein
VSDRTYRSSEQSAAAITPVQPRPDSRFGPHEIAWGEVGGLDPGHPGADADPLGPIADLSWSTLNKAMNADVFADPALAWDDAAWAGDLAPLNSLSAASNSAVDSGASIQSGIPAGRAVDSDARATDAAPSLPGFVATAPPVEGVQRGAADQSPPTDRGIGPQLSEHAAFATGTDPAAAPADRRSKAAVPSADVRASPRSVGPADRQDGADALRPNQAASPSPQMRDEQDEPLSLADATVGDPGRAGNSLEVTRAALRSRAEPPPTFEPVAPTREVAGPIPVIPDHGQPNRAADSGLMAQPSAMLGDAVGEAAVLAQWRAIYLRPTASGLNAPVTSGLPLLSEGTPAAHRPQRDAASEQSFAPPPDASEPRHAPVPEVLPAPFAADSVTTPAVGEDTAGHATIPTAASTMPEPSTEAGDAAVVPGAAARRPAGASMAARVSLRRVAEAMLPAPAIAGETIRAARTREAASPSPRSAPDATHHDVASNLPPRRMPTASSSEAPNSEFTPVKSGASPSRSAAIGAAMPPEAQSLLPQAASGSNHPPIDRSAGLPRGDPLDRAFDDDAAQPQARLQDGDRREVPAWSATAATQPPRADRRVISKPHPARETPSGYVASGERAPSAAPQHDESATSTSAPPYRPARQPPSGTAETAIADHQPAAVDPALRRERAMPPQPTGFLPVGSDAFETNPSPGRSMPPAAVRPAARAERSTAGDDGSAVLRADPPGSRLPGADAAAVDSSALDNPSMSPQPSADGQPAARPRAQAPVLPSEAGRRGRNLERLDKRGTDSEAPIRVSIGRITVEPPAASTRPPPFQRPRPTLSLNDYLARRRKSE